MATYRSVHLSFWTDNKVEDDFSPEDKYFYLYLLTNPQTNICGCYEISYKQTCWQTGYERQTIDLLIERLEKEHNVIKYCKRTKEILVLNWYKYNWNKSEKTISGVENVAKHIKCDEFKRYVLTVLGEMKKDIQSNAKNVKSNSFNNFNGRNYSVEALKDLEKELICWE